MDSDRSDAPAAVIGSLVHLTGPAAGTESWLTGSTLDICLTASRRLQIVGSRAGEPPSALVARMHAAGETYEIEAPQGHPLWVNRHLVTARRLEHGDIVELGETGPLTRFRLHREESAQSRSIDAILADCIDYLRSSRRPFGRRILNSLRSLLWQLTSHTSILFRVAVISAFAVFGVLAYQQYRLNAVLQESIESGIARLDVVSAALSRARDEALHASDLTALRDEVAQRLSSSMQRLEALERRSGATSRVIAQTIASVGFIQGSYGFRDETSGRMLRHVIGSGGQVLIAPNGKPLLTLEGDGPVAELQFSGTGFLVGESRAILTNRHVALPWESETGSPVPGPGELQQVMSRFIVYFPGMSEAVAVDLLLASDKVDLALLASDGLPSDMTGLRLAASPPAAGDEVIVMGYPTGLRSMLAQSGTAFIEELMDSENTGFWEVAARLAERGLVSPLASRGIVGQITAAAIVYDAETTHGGSGGPVVNTDGDVVAVNSAILPEYGGSNLGVPAEQVRLLLEEAGLR